MIIELSGIVISKLMNSDPVRIKIGSSMNKIGSGMNILDLVWIKIGSCMNKSLGQSMATNKFGSGTNKMGSGTNISDLVWIKFSWFFYNFLRFEDKGRIHIVDEELCGSLPENSHAVGQQVKEGATAPAGQRRPQCVVSDLAFFTT